MSGKAQLVRKTANRARERLSNARQGRIRSPNGWELRKRPTRRGRNRLRNGWAEAGQTVCQEKIPRQAARSPAVYPASASDNRQGIGIQLRTREVQHYQSYRSSPGDSYCNSSSGCVAFTQNF
ncbi:hypothetical protein MJO29_014852 [Puccinia striiformis f. sp. tritici]|nr:hypothetical protein MJO29_014852 [Puccinia striiformis f. sp. tritici]